MHKGESLYRDNSHTQLTASAVYSVTVYGAAKETCDSVPFVMTNDRIVNNIS